MSEPTPARLVAYFGNRYADHFERDLEEIVGHGFDGVVHCVTEADQQWGMKRIAELFAITRESGLSCWADPWGVAGVFGGEAHSGFLARGGVVGPEEPALRALVHNWIDDMADAGAEWVFWDEPDLGLGHSPATLEAFLADITGYAHSRRLRNSVCLTSTVVNRPAFGTLADLETVDDIGTDPYYKLDLDHHDPDPEDYVGMWAELVRAVAEARGKTSHVWVQAFHLAEGQEHRIAKCIEVARAHRVSRIGVWGVRACEALDIRPARPDVAWSVVRDALR
jgi:hypothetical protein